MFKPIPVAIGLRYLRAKRRNGFISFVSLASILGIAIGVMVLITTLAVMSGFQRESSDQISKPQGSERTSSRTRVSTSGMFTGSCFWKMQAFMQSLQMR